MGENESECKTNEVGIDAAAQRLDLKLIDFTNFVIVERYLEPQKNEEVIEEEEDKNEERCQLNAELDNLEQPDHGILFGLEGLMKLLSELKERGNIKSRNEKEWTRFSERICSSKMALRPFKN